VEHKRARPRHSPQRRAGASLANRRWRPLYQQCQCALRPASHSGRRSAPPLFGHALAARAPHGRAYLPFQYRRRQPQPAAEPWHVARSQSPAPIVSDASSIALIWLMTKPSRANVALQLGQYIWRQRHVLRGVYRCKTLRHLAQCWFEAANAKPGQGAFPRSLIHLSASDWDCTCESAPNWDPVQICIKPLIWLAICLKPGVPDWDPCKLTFRLQ
jgi:hypothetical protein